MTLDQAADWGLRLVMMALTVLVFVWGRNNTLADELVTQKAGDLRRLVEHDRAALTILVDVKAAALERSVSDKSHALDRLFESQFALRDERIGAIAKQLEDAAERASTAASKLTGKLGEVDHRLTVLETKQAAKA